MAVCTAPAKGVQKKDQGEGRLVPGKGLEGDGHFGFAHRQVSLLDAADIEVMKRSIPTLFHGAFAENLVTEGIDLKSLVLGDLLRIGTAPFRVTQIGKECHSGAPSTRPPATASCPGWASSRSSHRGPAQGG